MKQSLTYTTDVAQHNIRDRENINMNNKRGKSGTISERQAQWRISLDCFAYFAAF